MDEIMRVDSSQEVELAKSEMNLVRITEEILFDTKADISNKSTLSLPITELATLGAGVSSLIPALNTVTQTATVNTHGLFRLANAGVGDVLKKAKNGNYWGAFHMAGGSSKFAQLQAAGPISTTVKTVLPLNPGTIMMAVALSSIEKQLGDIEKMQKQILSFLEVEKESEIEADIETLVDIIKKYKLNWDNEHFITSNHKLVLDIQRTARKNMNAYQKKVKEALDSTQLVAVQAHVDTKLGNLQKKFKYYRLSLYTFSLASLLEILLSGNFKEEYISGIENEICSLSQTYRDLFSQSSVYLEKMSDSAIDTNILKSLGSAGKAVGKLIGGIPVIKNGPVDEFFQNSGVHLRENAIEMEKKTVKQFATISNPSTGVFVDQMNKMIRIYNHTSEIYFDNEKIYLVGD